MRELYIEGVAIHDGPESCVGVPRGRSEALTGVRAGWAIEPRNHRFRVPTSCQSAEGHVCWRRYRESPADPARSENLGTHGISMRENREIPSVARGVDAPSWMVRGGDDASGREGKAVIPR